jgi:MFS family permease
LFDDALDFQLTGALYDSIVANTTSLKHRPIYQAISGGMESVALALGPIISGAVAHASNWRVSFYIIIPVGVACILSVFFFVHNLQRPEKADLDNKEKLRRLDLLGFAIYVPTIVCLILGLQWGGSEYAWGNWRIVLLLVLAGILLILFLTQEIRAGDDGMFPLSMLRQRTAALSSAYTFCNSAALFVVAYYVRIKSVKRSTQCIY